MQTALIVLVALVLVALSVLCSVLYTRGRQQDVMIAHFAQQSGRADERVIGILSRYDQKFEDLKRVILSEREGRQVAETELMRVQLSPAANQVLKTGTISLQGQLARLIGKFFDDTQVRSMAMDLSIDYENLRNGTKQGKAMSLVEEMDRRNKLHQLLAYCRTQRPDAPWPSVKYRTGE